MVERPAIPREVRDEAARWVAEDDAGLLDGHAQEKLAQWLAADPVHRQAYDRALGLWAALGDVPDTPALRRVHRPVVRGIVSRRRGAAARSATPSSTGKRLAAVAGAASVLVASAMALDVPTRLQADAITATGERRLVVLPDGSTAHLNTRSAIAVDYAADGRRIRLLRGEAEFAVKPDVTRPFTVSAAGGTARALGTKFIVKEDAGGGTVTVTEHRVAVAFGGVVREVGESERVHFDAAAGLGSSSRIDIADAQAWTRGRLIAVNRPLAEVAAELARYYPGYIHVDPKVADLRVSANLRIDDPIAALGQLQRAIGVGSTRITSGLVFLHK